MKKMFIDKELNIFYDDVAKELIDKKNDSIFLNDESIVLVSEERWLEAQNYERKTWMVSNKHISDDRNYEHYNRFNSYNELVNYQKNNKIETVIELGCGPFTNLRTILNKLPNLIRIDLLDPLLNDYLDHPNCFYKNKKVLGFDTYTHSTPIEKFTPEIKYDLIIMNNVLEHCYDISKIFGVIQNSLKPGGLFVFSDVYFTGDDAKKMVTEIYDAGHPIKISKKILDNFLENYEILYEKDFEKLYGQHWRNDKYFIGVKK